MKANAHSLCFGTAALSCNCKTHKRVFSKQKYYHWWVSLFPKLRMVFSAPLCYCAAASRLLLLLLLLFLCCCFFSLLFLFIYLHLTYLIPKNLLNSVEFLINGKYGVERGSERDRERETCVCVCVCVWRKVKEKENKKMRKK